MTDRGLAPGDRATACPFVAFADDRDERSDQPDHRHRCYAESRPAPRALAHQNAYCLSASFAACPTFQDWARREQARTSRSRPAGSTVLPAGAAGLAESAWARDADAAATSPGAPVGDAADDGAGERVGAAAQGPGPASAPGAASEPGAAAQPGAGEAEAAETVRSSGLADPWLVADAVDDLRLPPRRQHQRDWAAPPPWAGGGGTPAAAGMPSRRDSGDSGEAGDSGDSGEARGVTETPAAPTVPAGADRPVSDAAVDVGAPAFLAERERRLGGAGAAGDSDEASWEAAMERAAAERLSRQAQRRPPARERPEPVADGVPPWEPPRRYEAYPALRSRMELPRPRATPIIGALALVLVAAAALFFLPPVLLNLGGGGSGGGTGAASPSPSASAAQASPTPVPSPTPIVYVVKKGDTLSRIAKRFGVTIDQIVQANQATVKDPNKIGEGDQLIIPTPVPSEVPGDSSSPLLSPSPSG